MAKSTVWFLYMGLIYLAAGVVLGLVMIFQPVDLPVFLRVHAHVNLLGWVSMMIFGVSYHVLPRFSGRPVRFPRLIWPHFWLTNGGLIGMVVSWSLGAGGTKAWTHLAGLFGLAFSVGVGMFICNMLTTIRVAAPSPMASQPYFQLPCQRPSEEAPEAHRAVT